MKKSKILVPALAVLALGVAGASVGTVAWFEASANTHEVDSGENFHVKSSALNESDFFFIVEVAPESSTTKVDLTDSEGNAWSIVNGKYQQATPDKPYSYVTLTPKAYHGKEEGGSIVIDTTKPATAAELKSLSGTSWTVTVQGEARTRLSFAVATVYSAETAGSVELTLSVTSEGTLSLTGTGFDGSKVYYSINGNKVATVDPVAGGDAADADKDANTVVDVGGVAVSLVKNA